MVCKLFALFALVAVASAAILPTGQIIPEAEAPAHYNFKYQVNDPVTGDQKHQEETREGDAVRGSYSLVESDGTRRIVEYSADDVNGFQAVVHKEPVGGVAPAVVAKAVKPIVAVAPAVAHSPLVAKVATIPSIRAYNGAYTPYHAGYAHPYAHPYAVNPYQYSGYNQGYYPYHLNHLNNYYNY